MTSSVTSSFKKQGLSLGHQKQPAEVTGWGTVTRFCSRLPPHLPVSSTTRELKLSKSSAKRNGWFHERRSSLNCPIWTSPRYLTGCRNPLNGGGVGSQVSSLSSKRADLFPLTPHSSHTTWVPRWLPRVRDRVTSWQQISLCHHVLGMFLAHQDTADRANYKPRILEALQNFQT